MKLLKPALAAIAILIFIYSVFVVGIGLTRCNAFNGMTRQFDNPNQKSSEFTQKHQDSIRVAKISNEKSQQQDENDKNLRIYEFKKNVIWIISLVFTLVIGFIIGAIWERKTIKKLFE